MQAKVLWRFLLMDDKSANAFYQGTYEKLAAQTSLAPLYTIEQFREVRQRVITSLIERDLAAAINRHMELVKRMDLSIQFTLPKGYYIVDCANP